MTGSFNAAISVSYTDPGTAGKDLTSKMCASRDKIPDLSQEHPGSVYEVTAEKEKVPDRVREVREGSSSKVWSPR